jgi:hypothetical protein
MACMDRGLQSDSSIDLRLCLSIIKILNLDSCRRVPYCLQMVYHLSQALQNILTFWVLIFSLCMKTLYG